jgi:O-methyltransferase involved in polyketide biosynthesis
MGFNVADADPLEYNFGAYDDGETHPIKEPTDKQVRRFFKNIAKEVRVADGELLATIANPDGRTDAEHQVWLAEHAEELEARQMEISEQSRRRVLGYLSEVCSGDPSTEQLEKLPERGQTRFLAYIRSELVPKG